MAFVANSSEKIKFFHEELFFVKSENVLVFQPSRHCRERRRHGWHRAKSSLRHRCCNNVRIRLNLRLHVSCSSFGGDAILKRLGGDHVHADILTFEGVAEAPLRGFRRWSDTLSRINNLVKLKCKIYWYYHILLNNEIWQKTFLFCGINVTN